ncbi:MAG: adenylate/guanylate cyclase domain-containing protein, partial [Rhizobium sp.]
VNQAARLESQAAPGEILVSLETTLQAPELMGGTEARSLSLKGIEQPVEARVLLVD